MRARRRWAAAVVLAAALLLVAPMPAVGDPLPWPLPASPPLPPDMTVPYLPATGRVICPGGERSCFVELEQLLDQRTTAVGCGHDAMFAAAYLLITRDLIRVTDSPDFFHRPDRITHEARTYAQEYFDQYDRWHAGDRDSVSPAWRIALQAADEESVTASGDLLLQLNAHIRRDNPIRAVEQTEGVLRVEGVMPAASGRHDHDQVSEALADSLAPMLAYLAAHYDPTVDDNAELFGTVFDPEGLYITISAWREESWRNAEQLRHARANGGVDGAAYQAKLAEIEAAAAAGAEAIRAATLTTPERNAERNAYCVAHRP